MREREFDKGYKSCFQFGKEVANVEWLNKIKQAREEIQSLDGRYVIGDYAIYGDNIPKYLQESQVLAVIDRLIGEVEDDV